MEDERYLEILNEGVEVWNMWRASDRHQWIIDLEGANLENHKLDRVNFDAFVNRSYLSEEGPTVSFTVILDNANLSRSSLRDAGFKSASLRGANLTGADLRGADFTGALLDDADFSMALMGDTIFGSNDLSSVKGLDTVRHQRSSTIGIDTLYYSEGNIPESFLRGAGIPETMIVYSQSLVGEAFEFYSCFISYSHKDEDFAKRLHSRLREANIRVWFAPEDIKGGQKLHEQIYQAIQIHDRLLVVLSEHSLQSEWVMTESGRPAKLRFKKQGVNYFQLD